MFDVRQVYFEFVNQMIYIIGGEKHSRKSMENVEYLSIRTFFNSSTTCAYTIGSILLYNLLLILHEQYKHYIELILIEVWLCILYTETKF